MGALTIRSLTCFLFLQVTFILSSSDAYKCGPSDKCECSFSTKGKVMMSCSYPNMSLSDVSAYVSNEPDITVLNLHNNFIRRIQNSALIGCEHVEQLDLSDCRIATIESEAFVSLSNLKWLDLSLNRDLGFESLINISYGLQFTKIDFLNISVIHHKFGLGTILRRQHICYLRNTTLREIAMDGNRIQQVEINALMLFPTTLQILHLNYNFFMIGPYLMQLACLSNLSEGHLNSRNEDLHIREYVNDPVINTNCVRPSLTSCPYDNEHYLRNISTDDCKFHENYDISIKDMSPLKVPAKLKTLTCRDSNFGSAVNRKLDIKSNWGPESYDLIGKASFIANKLGYIDLSGNHLFYWFKFVYFPKARYADFSRNGCANVRHDFFFSMPNIEHLNARRNFLGFQLSKDKEGFIFKPLKQLKYLDLSFNQIQYLPQRVFVHLISLQSLILSQNRIQTLNINFTPLQNLPYINMSSNSLYGLPESLTAHFNKMPNFTFDMTNNPIQISCQHEKFLKWMMTKRLHFVGFENYSFVDESQSKIPFANVESTINKFDKSCPSYLWVIITCSIFLAIFIAVVISGIVYRNRWKLRYFMYMNKNRMSRYRGIEEEAEVPKFRYDAFISYSDEDRQFIINDIIQNIENTGLKLCIHERDFIPGRYVHENILGAIQNSKKTVIILSKSFLQSQWCKYEFQMARMETIYARDGRSCIIMVLFEHVPIQEMSPEMAEMMKNNAYIEYTEDETGQILFWNRLNEAIRD